MTLLAPPAWHTRAACRGETAELFFETDLEPLGDRRERERAAVKVCFTCPVRTSCLEDALTRTPGEQVEVRGGYTANQRRTQLRARQRRNPQTTIRLDDTTATPYARVPSGPTLALLEQLRRTHTLGQIARAAGLAGSTVDGIACRRPARVALATALGITRAHTVLAGQKQGVAA